MERVEPSQPKRARDCSGILFLPQAKKDLSGKPGPAAQRQDAPIVE
jgi:hypothetical protein